jgi:hypothetical protein
MGKEEPVEERKVVSCSEGPLEMDGHYFKREEISITVCFPC